MASSFRSCVFSLAVFSLFFVAYTDPTPPPSPIPKNSSTADPLPPPTTLFYVTDLLPPSTIPQNLHLQDHKSLLEALLKRDAAREVYLKSVLPGSSVKKEINPATAPPRAISLDLYHRHFFESEVKDPKSLLESQLKRDADRANYLMSVLSEPAAELSALEGEFVVSISIGTPRKTELLVLDTGSSLTWLQCAPCEAGKCYDQEFNPIYDSAASSTFEEVDCRLTPRNCLATYTTCVGEHLERCEYKNYYLSGEESFGFLAYEEITFPVSETYSTIVIGCGKDQTNGTAFPTGFAGVVGLSAAMDPEGVGRLSLPVQLKSTLFSFCLPFPESKKKSSLNFNISPQLSGDSVIVPLLMHGVTIDYSIQLNFFNIGYYRINATANTTDWNGHVFVDSGTTLTRIPQSLYKLVKESTLRWMQFKDLQPLANPPSPFDICYNFVDVGDFPPVELDFGSSASAATLYLSGKQVAIKYDGNTVCLAFLPFDSYFILGNTQLYGTALTFDLSAMTLTFTKNSCNA